MTAPIIRETRRPSVDARPAALVGGAAAVIAGMAMHPTGANEDALVPFIHTHLARWGWTHIVLASGFVLLSVGLSSVPRLAAGARNARLITASALAAAVGSVLFAWETVAHAAVMQAVARDLPPGTALHVAKRYVASPYFLPFSAAASLLLPLGLIVLGIAMLRSRRIGTWSAVVLAVSPLAIQAGGAAGPRMLVAGIPLIAGCSALARAVHETSGVRTARPTPLAATSAAGSGGADRPPA